MTAQLSLLKQRNVRVRPTSVLARKSISQGSISAVQAHILHVLRVSGAFTDEQLYIGMRARCLDVSPSGCRTRRAELVRAGKVKANGTTTNSRGRRVLLWSIVK